VCKSYCEELRSGKCSGLWTEIRPIPLQIIQLPDCDTLPSAEEYFECFIPYNNGREARDVILTSE